MLVSAVLVGPVVEDLRAVPAGPMRRPRLLGPSWHSPRRPRSRVDLARGWHETSMTVRKTEPVSGFEPLTVRLEDRRSGGRDLQAVRSAPTWRARGRSRDEPYRSLESAQPESAGAGGARTWSGRSQPGEDGGQEIPQHVQCLFWGHVSPGVLGQALDLDVALGRVLAYPLGQGLA